MLDRTLIVAGSEFGDSDSHTFTPQPHLVLGGGGDLGDGRAID